MKTNIFGDMRAENYADIVQCLEEGLVAGDEVYAVVSADTDEGGYMAEVFENEFGDDMFNVIGYADIESLKSDLRQAGISDIQTA